MKKHRHQILLTKGKAGDFLRNNLMPNDTILPRIQPSGDTPATRRSFLQLGVGGAVVASLAGCGDDEIASPGTGTAPPQLTPPQLAPPQPAIVLPQSTFSDTSAILSEPMLQNPGADSVKVVWFSEIADGNHIVRIGPGFQQSFLATTTPMTHMLEDSGSQVFQRITGGLTTPQRRAVSRHEATITGLTPGTRTPYVAISEHGADSFRSGEYSLQPLPAAGQSLKILMTSDQQNFGMATANFQKVEEAIGPVDAVLFPGDLVNNPNRASEWFDRTALSNPSFFQSLQGTMRRWNPGSVFKGGAILQYAPLYPCRGNHEYPGRWRLDPQTDNPANTGANSINAMDGDPQPRWYTELRYNELANSVNPSGDPTLRAKWIQDNSFDPTTYEEMWSLPEGPEGSAYYAQRFGDVFIIALDANRIWRTWNANQRGKFTEEVTGGTTQVSTNTDEWGFGDFTFRSYARGSQQYAWLTQVLASEACRTAKYRIVLSHQTMAGLGDNAMPVLAEQRITVERTDGSLIGPFPASQWPDRWPLVKAAVDASEVRYVRYEYPLSEDDWRNDIEPLLLANDVKLVHTRHSHVWNRARIDALNYLETSNVGNSFGAMFYPTRQNSQNPNTGPRPTQPGNAVWLNATSARTNMRWDPIDYPGNGEPHGREMMMPTIFNPMQEIEQRPEAVPFVSSNRLTAFTIFDTGTGLVSSYVFDTSDENAPVRKFDEFSIA